MGEPLKESATARDPTVFVIDADEAVRWWTTLLIQTAGLNVQTYTSTEEFLVAYNASQPGCLLVDECTPGANPRELLAELAAKGAVLPVILVTGRGDALAGGDYTKSGQVYVVTKPCRQEVLLESIRRALEEDAARRRSAVVGSAR